MHPRGSSEFPPGASGAPGWAAAVFDRDRIRDAWYAGHANVATREPITEETRLRWFSVTKLATAIATMRLVEDGALALDEPVRRRLPWFRPWNDHRPITVADLLSHRGGLGNPFPIGWVHPPGARRRTDAELTKKLADQYRRLRWPPGERGHYSNLSYLLLGELIAAVAEEPYDRHVHRRVLAPAGLADTSFDPRPAAVGHEPLLSARSAVMAALFVPRTPRLIRYVRDGWVGLTAFELEGSAYGGLVGTLGDLVRLGQLHLNDGGAVLSAETARRMREVHATGPRTRFGLGFWFEDGWIGHGGEAGGYRSDLWLSPKKGLGVAALTNSGAGAIADVVAALKGSAR